MAHTEDTDVEILQITWLVLRALNCAFYCFMIGVGRSLFFLNFAYCMIFFFFIVRFGGVSLFWAFRALCSCVQVLEFLGLCGIPKLRNPCAV